jgi:hypothetical protein
VNPVHAVNLVVVGVIFYEWSFSIFIFLELLAIKLLDGG